MQKKLTTQQSQQYWRKGKMSLLKEVKLRRMPLPVWRWFISQLLLDEQGLVTGFNNPESGAVVAFGPKRWSVIVNLDMLNSYASDPGFCPRSVAVFLKSAMKAKCYALSIGNFDTTVLCEFAHLKYSEFVPERVGA